MDNCLLTGINKDLGELVKRTIKIGNQLQSRNILHEKIYTNWFSQMKSHIWKMKKCLNFFIKFEYCEFFHCVEFALIMNLEIDVIKGFRTLRPSTHLDTPNSPEKFNLLEWTKNKIQLPDEINFLR